MKVSRKTFLGGMTASFFVGGCASRVAPRKIPANGKVNVAIIGCGLIAKATNLPGFLKDPRCRVTIACDMVREAPGYRYGKKAGTWVPEKYGIPRDVCGSKVIKTFVDRHYGDTACREVFDWREVIDDPTVDAVCICTPDHWHAIIAIAAMRAGKHVFCQKPMSLSIAEGKAMAKVAAETGVTFQVGNQGRNNPKYRLAQELVLNGYAGKVLGATICIPGNHLWEGHGGTKPVPRPAWMSDEAWDLWQGPARHFPGNAFIPCIHEPTCWRYNNRYGNGMVTDFGAHEFDQLQRGLGQDLSGPVAVENVTSDIDTYGDLDVLSWAGRFSFDFVYANGVRCHVRPIDTKAGFPRQTVFHCEGGDIGSMAGKPGGVTLPPSLAKFTEADFKATDRRLYHPSRPGYTSNDHESDFIDGILEGRPCCSPCAVGHRTITLAHLANAAIRLRVSKLGWDPVREVFSGPHAEAAMAQCYRSEYHNGWTLDA